MIAANQNAAQYQSDTAMKPSVHEHPREQADTYYRGPGDELRAAPVQANAERGDHTSRNQHQRTIDGVHRDQARREASDRSSPEAAA
jgi:hypothetical protein